MDIISIIGIGFLLGLIIWGITGLFTNDLMTIGEELTRVNKDSPAILDKYTQRLLDEWRQHGKIIIAIDVDDTILPYRTSTQKECDKVIQLVKDCQTVGAWVVLYTCRNSDGIVEAMDYCRNKGLHIDAANRNPEGVNLPFGHHAKPYANIFLDDRAHLQGAVERLSECMYRMRSEKLSQKMDYDGSSGF